MQAIAALLRVLNALENIRSSINVAERGLMMTSADDMRDLARLSLEETIDAMQVLSEGALERHVEPTIFSARARLLSARLTLDAAQHLKIRRAIDNLLEAALRHLRAARSHLADPTTLPPSFRN